MAQYIEDNYPPMRDGLKTQKAVTFEGTLAVTGAVTLAGGVTSTSPTAGLGYATGAGGAVTQASTITTGVTVQGVSGTITTVASTLAAQATVEFIVTNGSVAVGDVVAVSTTYAGAGSPMVSVAQVGAGSFSIVLFNATTATTALNAVVVINFAVIKAVSA